MRTSVDLPDHLLALARARATADRSTLREVVIASLSQYLLEEPVPLTLDPDAPYPVPVFHEGKGGMFPHIDPTDSSALLEIE